MRHAEHDLAPTPPQDVGSLVLRELGHGMSRIAALRATCCYLLLTSRLRAPRCLQASAIPTAIYGMASPPRTPASVSRAAEARASAATSKGPSTPWKTPRRRLSGPCYLWRTIPRPHPLLDGQHRPGLEESKKMKEIAATNGCYGGREPNRIIEILAFLVRFQTASDSAVETRRRLLALLRSSWDMGTV